MAYSQSTSPLPPPPPEYDTAREFSNAYDIHRDNTSKLGTGIAPVNQMSNGFGGRTGGNATVATRPALSGGNRTSQHLATPGNNNVSYPANSTLYQAAAKQGIPTMHNAMSMGFLKSHVPRAGKTPVSHTPSTTTTNPTNPGVLGATGTNNATPTTISQTWNAGPNATIQPPPPPGTPAPAPSTYSNGLTSDMFSGQTLYVWSNTLNRNVAKSIENMTHAEVLAALSRPINQKLLSPSYYYDNGHIYRR